MATILIVDAHANNRVYLVRILEYCGHRLIQAADAEAGIEFAATKSFDLALVDFPLPSMAGADFLGRLRAVGPLLPVPVVVLTDFDLKQHTQDFANAYGVVAVLAKPCEPERAIRVVESALTNARSLQTASTNGTSLYEQSWEERDVGDIGLHEAAISGETLVDRPWPTRDPVNSEAEFEDLCERSPIPFGRAGLDLYITHANAALIRLLGYAKPELFSKTWPDIVHPEDRAECCEDLATLRSGGEVAARERRFLHRSGRTVIGSAHTFAIRGSTGQPYAFATQILDISNWKLTAVELSQTRERLEDILDLSQVVVCEIALESAGPRVVWASANVSTMTGYSPGEAVEPGWWTDRLHPEDATEIAQELVAEERATREYRIRHRDGSFRWVSARAHRSGAGIATVAWTDISDRKRLEDSHRQSQKLASVGRLASGVAHDFNNMLTIIAGYGEHALNVLPPDHPAFSMLQQIVAAREQAAKLVRQLLAFGQNGIARPEPLDLRTVVAAMQQMVARVLRQDIHIETLADADLGVVSADTGQIQQLLLNLILNSQDAMPQGGRLAISLRNASVEAFSAGRAVLLAVGDTGCGMDAATKARIFEPYFTTKDREGGLGLASVQETVRLGGGFVDVVSEVGRGTTMKIYWPRIDALPAALDVPPAPPAWPRGSETVLLVEDEDAVRDLVRQVLVKCGYTVLVAPDGPDALRVAAGHPGRIDLLITDLMLPNLDGRKIADELKEIHGELRILFVSGYGENAVERGGPCGPDSHFLGKPFKPAELAAKVRDVLG